MEVSIVKNEKNVIWIDEIDDGEMGNDGFLLNSGFETHEDIIDFDHFGGDANTVNTDLVDFDGGGGGFGGSVTENMKPHFENLSNEVTTVDRDEKVEFTVIDGGIGGSGGIGAEIEGTHLTGDGIKNTHFGGGCNEAEIKEESSIDILINCDDYKVDFKGGGICACVCGGGSNGGGGGGSSPTSVSSSTVPKPIQGLSETGPPPFLTKTYEMVENPSTDWIVSWNNEGDSFIVKDAIEFSTSLLPKYFKHSNFSSFIRQLNTYGFRKVDHDRWEFGNDGFKKGKKHLLKNIKRRRQNSSQTNQQQKASTTVVKTAKAELEAKFESLKKDQTNLGVEIQNLKLQQENSANNIAAFERRIQSAKHNHQQLLLFFARTVNSPKFVQKLMDNKRQRSSDHDQLGYNKRQRSSDHDQLGYNKRQRSSDHDQLGYATEAGKRRRIDGVSTNLSLNFLTKVSSQLKILNGVSKTKSETQSDMVKMMNDSMNDCYKPECPVMDNETNMSFEASYPNSPNPGWEKVTEDLLSENNEGELAVDDDGATNSKYLHELENLIDRPNYWDVYEKLVWDQVEFLGAEV